MNFEFFIARRLLKGDGTRAVSVPIVRIALVGIALGVCVMLLSIFIITGFKKEITDKLSGFDAHLNIVAYDNNSSFTGNEILAGDSLMTGIRNLPEVREAYVYITRPAILKSKEEIHGIILRGIDSSYSASFFRQHLVDGTFPDYRGEGTSNKIVLSASVASLLGLKTGDRVASHFVQDQPRVRMFTVAGIYDTGFKEYDDIMVLCDLRHLQKLNGWEKNEVSGIAMELKDITRTAEVKEKVDALLPWDDDDNFYKLETLRETAPQVFDWLDLLNMNVSVILVLIVIVAVFNMVSGLLILILDKTSLIGILKALGYRDAGLRKLFLYISIALTGRGMLLGNVLALILGGLQYKFKLITLDASSYYMDTVPVHFDWFYWLLLNVGVLLISVLMLVVPTMLISKIKPIKAIRFE